MKNSIFGWIVVNNSSVFIGFNCGDQYINSKLHWPIIYPNVADIYGMNLLWYTYGNIQFYENIIYNGLELLFDSDHTSAF